MKRILLLFVICSSMLKLSANEFKAYMIYDQSGNEITFSDVVESANKSEVVLFGELHNSPICHWLQFRLAKNMHEHFKEDLVIGAEMFETDNQMLINEYLLGLISEKSFEREARLWKNYQSDYKPVFEFAKENNLKFIATNIPRRYASFVAKEGLEKLEDFPGDAEDLIAPLPIDYDPELPGYKKMKEMSMPGHGMDYIAEAQAIKDATMAYFIMENREDGFLHLNGTYHSNNFEGIYWYLKNEDDDLKIITIATVEQENIASLEEGNRGLADFIIVIPSDMTKTY